MLIRLSREGSRELPFANLGSLTTERVEADFEFEYANRTRRRATPASGLAEMRAAMKAGDFRFLKQCDAMLLAVVYWGCAVGVYTWRTWRTSSERPREIWG